MGEVYRAMDSKLDREVAIKVLPESFAQDNERLARFEREAKVLAQLNHPNIAGVYGLEQSGDIPALILELVEGDDLSVRLKRGPLPVEEALEVCKQIAEALEAAHEKGIIHRDLKPGNIKLTKDGKVKVLDFGLAKALADESDQSASGSMEDSPTLTDAFTKPGAILGTAAYMSPEQARGKKVDHRCDVWAIGCVLFECLTTQKAFRGNDTTELLASIIKEEPDWSVLSKFDPSITLLLRKCLSKNLKKRTQHVGDIRIELEMLLDQSLNLHFELNDSSNKPTSPSNADRSGFFIPWMLATACLAALLTWFLKPLPATPSMPVRKFAIPVENVPHDFTTRIKPSPDGRFITFTTDKNIVVWGLDDLKVRQIPLNGAIFRTPVIWSPQSDMFIFARDRKLWKTRVDSVEPISICEIPGTGEIIDGSWGNDQQIVFSAWRGPMYQVSQNGGDPAVLISNEDLNAVDFHGVDHLPDGSIIHDTHSKDPRMDLATSSEIRRFFQGESIPILRGNNLRNPVYSTTGHILYNQTEEQRIYAVTYSLNESRITGEPFLVAQNASAPSVSDNGLLIYLQEANTQTEQCQMVWIDQGGQVIKEFGDPGIGSMSHRLSSDESTILYLKKDKQNNASLYLYDLEREMERRIILNETSVIRPNAPNWYSAPTISPQKDYIIFEQGTNLQNTLYALKMDGSGSIIELFAGQDASFSSNQRYMVFEVHELDGDTDIWMCELPESGEFTSDLQSSPIIHGDSQEMNPALSPNGQFIAYESGSYTERKIYAARFPELTDRREVSRGPGQFPQWSKDGETIYYVDQDHSMVAVSLESTPELMIGSPTPLFKLDESIRYAHFSVASNGSFLMSKSNSASKETTAVEIVVVENWFEEFRDGDSKR
jgi:serine/threonine protein kinase